MTRRFLTPIRRANHDRRSNDGFRKEDQAAMIARKKLINDLRMQARTRAAAHRQAKYEPTDPKAFLEWKAADLLEKGE